jgi:hypothetical protein
LTQDQLEVLEELEREIECATDPAEKEEYERTFTVCREFAYGLAEGMITVEEIEAELHFTTA